MSIVAMYSRPSKTCSKQVERQEVPLGPGRVVVARRVGRRVEAVSVRDQGPGRQDAQDAGRERQVVERLARPVGFGPLGLRRAVVAMLAEQDGIRPADDDQQAGQHGDMQAIEPGQRLVAELRPAHDHLLDHRADAPASPPRWSSRPPPPSSRAGPRAGCCRSRPDPRISRNAPTASHQWTSRGARYAPTSTSRNRNSPPSDDRRRTRRTGASPGRTSRAPSHG